MNEQKTWDRVGLFDIGVSFHFGCACRQVSCEFLNWLHQMVMVVLMSHIPPCYASSFEYLHATTRGMTRSSFHIKLHGLKRLEMHKPAQKVSFIIRQHLERYLLINRITLFYDLMYKPKAQGYLFTSI
jgi:hypothetical protein